MESDLSGRILAGSDSPVTITVGFPDGATRSLSVSASEADALATKGQPIKGVAWSNVRRNAWKAFKVVVALWLASVLIPAVVQQWQDRAKELELKSTLVTLISDSAADSITAARLIAGDNLPEARARQRAEETLRSAQRLARQGTGEASRITPTERRQIATAERAVEDAHRAELEAEQALYNDARVALITSGASTEAKLATYFDTPLVSRSSAFHRAVLGYFQLASSIEGLGRTALENQVLDFLCSEVHTRNSIEAAIIRFQCDQKREEREFPDYFMIGDELLASRVALLRDVVSKNASGYSTGPRDLFHALTFRVF